MKVQQYKNIDINDIFLLNDRLFFGPNMYETEEEFLSQFIFHKHANSSHYSHGCELKFRKMARIVSPITKKYKFEQMSRLVFQYHNGMNCIEGSNEIDHRDGNTLNNNILNLRQVTSSQNKLNSAHLKSEERGSSKYIGVFYVKATGKWMARTCVAGIIKSRSRNTEWEAALARDLLLLNEYPKNLTCELDLPGNNAGNFIPKLNIMNKYQLI